MRKLALPASLESLEEIGAYVVRAAAEAGLDVRAAYNLRLAVDEVATNIASYGYGEQGGDGEITLWGELSPEDLTIVIEDSGTPFDPLAKAPLAEEELSLPLEDRPIGGLGIYLVLQGVDSFRYEYRDGRNRNIFAMKRPVVSVPV